MSRGRVVVLYNIDYDASGAGNPDAASVADAATAISAALGQAGYTAERVGIRGAEVHEVLARVAASKPDVVFNLCESMAGQASNEPTFAGLLDLHGIPYTGSNLLTLASCLFKHRTKDILIAHGVPTPPYLFLRTLAHLDDPSLDALDYPYFVKLAHEDASLGITEANRCTSAVALRTRARELMVEFHQGVIVERYIEGREINVTLIGDGPDVQVMPLAEIDFGMMPADRPRIVSYAAKWDENHVDYAGTKPVPLEGVSDGVLAEIRRVARAAWDAVELRDYGRVDLRLDAQGVPWVIDVNPNPDLSPDAGVARSAARAALTYPELVTRIAELARRRAQPRAASS